MRNEMGEHRAAKRLMKFAAAGTLVLGLAAVPPPAYAVGCQDDGCAGKDPMVQNCDDDAVTLVAHYEYGQWVGFNLRYSQACNAVWTRIVDNRPQNFCDVALAARVQSRRWVDSANEFVIADSRIVRQTSETRCYGQRVWTKMIGAGGTSERASGGQALIGTNEWWWHSAWQ